VALRALYKERSFAKEPHQKGPTKRELFAKETYEKKTNPLWKGVVDEWPQRPYTKRDRLQKSPTPRELFRKRSIQKEGSLQKRPMKR